MVAAGAGASFSAWFFDRRGQLVAPKPPGPELRLITSRRRAVDMALIGSRYTSEFPGGVRRRRLPCLDGDAITGALLGRSSRSGVLQSAIDRLRNDSLQALVVGVCIAILIGFAVASLITYRIRRLARSAENMAAGALDVPLQVGGRDEVGDLARALDQMRGALQDSFQVLSS